LEFTVKFGNGWKRDDLGLAGIGKIVVNEDTVVLNGRQHTALMFKILLWLMSAMMTSQFLSVAISIILPDTPMTDMRFIVALIIGSVLVIGVSTFVSKYFGSSPYSSAIPKKAVAELTREGKLIKFRVSSQGKRHMFRAVSEQEAQDIELALS
jgi:hypothetical protein